jgi:hypothetical protein
MGKAGEAIEKVQGVPENVVASAVWSAQAKNK